MRAEYKSPIQYSMVLSEQIIPVNEHIGSNISLKWSGDIHCVKCGRRTNKSFFQGFCYPCFINAPESSECILKPELCQAHEGISRDIIYTYYYSPIKPKKDFNYKESDNYNAKYKQRYAGDFKKGSFLSRILKKIK